MSTTVEYKGNTIASFSNDTKVLNTGGTWVEGDITITDVSGSGSAITITDTTDSHGGTVRTITGVSLAGITVSASHLEQGYTAVDSMGNLVNGELVPGGGGTMQAKTNIDPTTSSQTITPDTGYDGLSSVQINAMPSGSATTPASTITSNPSINVNSSGVITASVSASKSITPTVSAGYVSTGTAGTVYASGSSTYSLSTQAAATVTPTQSVQTAVDASKYTTGAVKVAAIPSTYVGSGITSRSSSSLSASGATVTAPAGYYSAAATKSVASGTVTAPASISGTSATVSTGTNTLTLSKTVSVTPSVTTAGYVSSGTAGNSSVSLTANVTTKGATTYNTSSTDQTIASGTYLTGTQTIKAVTVSGLSAANIADGVTVKVGDANDDDRIASVTGTLAFQTIYSGSSAPSSSTGVNGDVYIQTS